MKNLLTGMAIIATLSLLLFTLANAQQDVPTQDPSTVDIHPDLQSKFQQSGTISELFNTKENDKEEIFVKLETYDRPSNIQEMKSQASVAQQPLLKMAEKNPQVEVKNEFWITNAVLIEASTEFPLENIASVQGVERLDINAEITAAQTAGDSTDTVSPQSSNTYGLDQINATETWDRFNTQGDEVKVSVIDTGIDKDHDDIDLFTNDESDPTFPGGWAEFKGGKVEGSEPKVCEHGGGDHGTHVSGTVSGGDASGTNIGVAPNVSLMNVGALMHESSDGNCVGSLSDITDAMQWSVENNASVLSLSLGASGKRDTFIEPVRNAQAAGVIVIGASGNDGEGASGSPGNVYDATAVGASDSDEDIASFSSGEKINTDEDWDNPPSDWPDEYIVPDLAAPGVSVYSSEPGNDYGFKQGTSMATPHVSGAAALMQSATIEYLSPQNISESFVQTAWKPSDWDETGVESIDGQDVRYGHGIIDAYAATEYALNNFDQGEVIENVTVNVSEAEIEESFKVSGDVENLREQQNDVDLELLFNQSSAENQTVSLEAEESKEFEFEHSISDEGFYEVYVNESFAGGLDVYMPDPEFNIVSELNESEIVEDDYAEVSGIVNNTGGDGEADLRLLKNDTAIDQKSVFVPFESDENYSFVTRYSEPGYYEIKVNNSNAGNLNVLKDAELNISDFNLNNSEEFFKNDTVEASVNATNIGEVEGDFNISFEIDGVEDQTQQVTIGPESSEIILFEKTFSDRGNYTLSSGNLSENLEVLKPGSIQLNESSLSNNTIVEGESINYSLQFENPGDVEASDTLEFMIGSEVEESRNVSLDKRSNNQTVFNQSFDSPGNYTLSVNSSLEQNLQVLKEAELNITGLSLSNSSIVEGENITANVTAENIGDVSSSLTVPLNITGESEFNLGESREFDSGEELNMSFDQQISDPGSYTAETINHTESFDVLEQANITVTNSSVNTTKMFTGQDLGFNITVENTGEVSGSTELNYSLGSLNKSSSTGIIEPGEKNISNSLKPLNSGNFTAKLNDSNISEVEVEKPEVNIVNASFNVSEKGLIEVETELNNTDPGLVNETLTYSLNNSNKRSGVHSLEKNERKNVSDSFDWNETGFYTLELNGSKIGNFALEPYAEFSSLSPDGATYTEGDNVEFTGQIYSVGEPNLTVRGGGAVFEENQSSGLQSFSFEDSFSAGSYDWFAEASFSNSSFTSETLNFEVEEETTDSGGGSGGSGGGLGGGAPAADEVELEVNESSNSIKIKAPEGEHNLEFNETDLPIRSLQFSSEEEGAINFSSSSVNHTGSMEAIFEAETDLDNSFTITVEASNHWIQENNFDKDQISFYRFENGWNNLNPDSEERDNEIIFSSNLESFSIFGVGSNQACYSMDEVRAETNDSCSTYSNICEVPEDAELVESCESDSEQRVRDRIDEARDSGADDEDLRDAEAALEEGRIQDAEEILNRSSQTNFGSSELEFAGNLTRYLTSIGVFTLAGLLLHFGLPAYRKKRLFYRVDSLTYDIKGKAKKGESVEKLAKMVARANEALIKENYDEAEKILNDAEKMK